MVHWSVFELSYFVEVYSLVVSFLLKLQQITLFFFCFFIKKKSSLCYHLSRPFVHSTGVRRLNVFEWVSTVNNRDSRCFDICSDRRNMWLQGRKKEWKTTVHILTYTVTVSKLVIVRPGRKQLVHWFLGGKGLGVHQGTSVWVGSPTSLLYPVWARLGRTNPYTRSLLHV